MTVLTVNLTPTFNLTEDAFDQLCQNNPDIRFERNAQGALVIMPPMGAEDGKREADLTLEVALWNRQARLGVVFSPSTGFTLPNGAIRSPDVAWIAQARWDALTPDQRRRFPPIAPDFVIELRSATDELADLQAKMQEYIANGVKLGWLIDPFNRTVTIYRPNQPIELLTAPLTVSGEPLLPGFEFDLSQIFN